MENVEIINLDDVERYQDNEHLPLLLGPEFASNGFRNRTATSECGTSRDTKINYSKEPKRPLRDLLQENRRRADSVLRWNDIKQIRCNIDDGFYVKLATAASSLEEETPSSAEITAEMSSVEITAEMSSAEITAEMSSAEITAAMSSAEIAAKKSSAEIPPEKSTDEPSKQESSTRDQTLMDDMHTELLETIRQKNSKEFDKLLINGASPNAKNAVHVAAATHGDYYLLQLLKLGAVRDTPDEYGSTPLHLAVRAGEKRNVELLLNFPSNTNSYEHVKASTSSKEIFDKKKFVNSKVRKIKEPYPRFFLKEGFTALHIAAAFTQPECISLLLSAGADPNAKDVDDFTPLDVAGVVPFHSHLDATEKFTEVIKQLAKRGELNMTKKTAKNLITTRTPLHVAVALKAIEGIEELIHKGVSVTTLNMAGKTALHMCVEKKFEKGLEILAKYAQNDVNSSVDVIDKWGSTVLQDALYKDWLPGVCIALDAGADVTIGEKSTDNNTPIHIAATLHSKDSSILSKILIAAKQRGVVNIRNHRGETALFKAVAAGREDYVKALLKEGASIKLCLSNLKNVFHIAATHGNLEVLSVLFFHYQERETQVMVQVMINERVNSKSGFTPLHFAVDNNHYECAKFLLHVGADVIGRGWSSSPYHNSTPLHIAAEKNDVEMAKLLIKYDNFQSTQCRNQTNLVRHRNIEEIDSQGWYPIHTAARHASYEIIPILLKAGSDLSAKIEDISEAHEQSLKRPERETENVSVYVDNNKIKTKRDQAIYESEKERKTAVEMLIKNIPKPTEFLENIFDTYIFSIGKDLQNTDEILIVDFAVLLPLNKTQNQKEFTYSFREWSDFQENTYASDTQMESMNVIKELVKTGNRYNQRRLLVHPLVECFLYLRWKELQPFFYATLACHALFVLILTIFVVTVFLERDGKNQYPTWLKPTMGYMLYVPIVFLILQEILYINFKRSDYFRHLESWVKIGSIAPAFILPLALNIGPATEWSRHVATVALLLSWIEMMLLIARFPKWGYYVYMFGRVASNVIKILLTFVFIVIGFSFCFMIQFRSKTPFESVWASIVKTMVMMTSEFDYGNLFDDKHFQDTTDVSAAIARSFFVIFAILVAIVLMNLMVGVSVNDINNLKVEGNKGRLAKQVEFLGTLESLLCYNILRTNRIPTISGFLKRKLLQMNIPQKLEIHCEQPKSRYMKMLPSHIKEAIFKRCLGQNTKKRRIDQEAEKQELEKKMEANYDKIIKVIEKETKNLREVLDYNKQESVKALREVVDYNKQETVKTLREVLDYIKRETVEAHVKAKESITKMDHLYDKVYKMEKELKKNYRRMSM